MELPYQHIEEKRREENVVVLRSIDHGVVGGEEHLKHSEGERSRWLLQTPQR